MTALKTILILLLLQILAFAAFAEDTHYSTDSCFPDNNWHWFDSQDDKKRINQMLVNCPLVVAAPAPDASSKSIFEHTSLQVLAVTIPISSAAAVVVAFKPAKK